MVPGKRNVVIVGASAAGLRCAARLIRLEPSAEVTVVERSPVFSYAACGLPYALSGDVSSGEELRKTADGTVRDAGYFADIKGVTVRAGIRAVAIDAGARNLTLADGETLPYDELVLATGARPRRLPQQPVHDRVHTFHTLADLEPLVEGLKRGRIGQVAVIGAGLCGCEIAEALTVTWGAEVTLLEAAPGPLPMVLDPDVAALVTATLSDNQVTFRGKAPVRTIVAEDDRVAVHTTAGEVTADVAVVALGVAPATELAVTAKVALGETGAIAVDDQLRTSVPHVWACGDCIEVVHAVSGKPCHLPLGSLANRQGRLLASILCGSTDRWPRVAGAAGLKVFDTNVAAVGLTTARAAELGLEVRAAWWCGYDRAHYYPEAKEIALKIIYEPRTERVLGVQGAGPGEVHKRIDVAAQLVLRGGSLRDLAELEHAYSPPYAPAIDPLAILAMVALNQQQGLEAVSPLSDLAGFEVLDVRQLDESAARPVVGASVTVLPQADAKKDARSLADREWLVVCERGTRSAEMAGWLLSHRIHARYLGGGLRWRALAGAGSAGR